jgi:hypothetical protein
MKSILIVFAALLSLSCNNSDFPRYTTLDRLRVVALIPSQAESAPGDTVTVTPYVSDIAGGGRALTYTAVRCLDPGINYGATPTCDGSASRVAIANAATVTGLASPSYSGNVNTFSVSIPSLAEVFAGRTAQSLYNGVPYLVTYTLTAAGEEPLIAFTRIIVSNKTPKNTHPASINVFANGVTFTTLPGAEFNLSADFPSTSSETYNIQNSDGSFRSSTEALQTTWFTTDGKLKRDRTIGLEAVTYGPPSSFTTGRMKIIAVTRDGRGGITLTEKTF